jgi:hypothetical protein
MQRETTTIRTPGGHTVEVYSYITGREARELQRVIYENAQIESGDGAKRATVRADAIFKAQEYAFKTMVVSLNGNRENAVEAVENLPAVDYNAVARAIDKIIAPAIEGDEGPFLAK